MNRITILLPLPPSSSNENILRSLSLFLADDDDHGIIIFCFDYHTRYASYYFEKSGLIIPHVNFIYCSTYLIERINFTRQH